jgi:hypothetical protein
LRDAQRVHDSEEMAATKPLGRDILVSSRACSSHYVMSGEDIARVLAHVIQRIRRR